MDRAALGELFDYTGWAWERIARVLDGLPEGTFGRAVEGSGWPRLSDCVEHFTAAYDGWLNGRWALQLGKMRYPSETFPGAPELRDWATMKEYRAGARADCKAAMAVADDVLFAKMERDFGDGPEVISRGDIIANLFLHERGHHGDLNTLFHQLGVKSYIIDYRYFVTKRHEFTTDDFEG